MVDIVDWSRFATAGAMCDIYHIARSALQQIGEEHRVVGTLRRPPHHMHHRVGLQCHRLCHGCSPLEAEAKAEGEAEGELSAKVVPEMVRQVMA